MAQNHKTHAKDIIVHFNCVTYSLSFQYMRAKPWLKKGKPLPYVKT